MQSRYVVSAQTTLQPTSSTAVLKSGGGSSSRWAYRVVLKWDLRVVIIGCTSIENVALAVAALVLLRCRTCARLAAQTVLLKMQLCGYTSAFFRLVYQEEPVVHVSQKELLLQ